MWERRRGRWRRCWYGWLWSNNGWSRRSYSNKLNQRCGPSFRRCRHFHCCYESTQWHYSFSLLRALCRELSVYLILSSQNHLEKVYAFGACSEFEQPSMSPSQLCLARNRSIQDYHTSSMLDLHSLAFLRESRYSYWMRDSNLCCMCYCITMERGNKL